MLQIFLMKWINKFEDNKVATLALKICAHKPGNKPDDWSTILIQFHDKIHSNSTGKRTVLLDSKKYREKRDSRLTK